MLKPIKRVMNEYHTLVVKMVMDFASNNYTRWTLSFYVILRSSLVFYGLVILLPLLEEVNKLMKLAQSWNVFVIDYVVTIKLC
jgi:hypothetical protein